MRPVGDLRVPPARVLGALRLSGVATGRSGPRRTGRSSLGLPCRSAVHQAGRRLRTGRPPFRPRRPGGRLVVPLPGRRPPRLPGRRPRRHAGDAPRRLLRRLGGCSPLGSRAAPPVGCSRVDPLGGFFPGSPPRRRHLPGTGSVLEGPLLRRSRSPLTGIPPGRGSLPAFGNPPPPPPGRPRIPLVRRLRRRRSLHTVSPPRRPPALLTGIRAGRRAFRGLGKTPYGLIRRLGTELDDRPAGRRPLRTAGKTPYGLIRRLGTELDDRPAGGRPLRTAGEAPYGVGGGPGGGRIVRPHEKRLLRIGRRGTTGCHAATGRGGLGVLGSGRHRAVPGGDVRKITGVRVARIRDGTVEWRGGEPRSPVARPVPLGRASGIIRHHAS